METLQATDTPSTSEKFAADAIANDETVEGEFRLHFREKIKQDIRVGE